jgi:hypothetical protein
MTPKKFKLLKRNAWRTLVDKCPSVMRSRTFADMTLTLTPESNDIHIQLEGFFNHKEPIGTFPSNELICKIWLLSK